MGDALERFTVHVDDAVLEDLRARLGEARFPDQIDGTGWEYGIPTPYVRALAEYWRDHYDWRAHEARLNELEHFRTTVDGQTIHYVHARSPHVDATPLLLSHGWPGTIVEFLDVIPMLTEPERYGGDASDAFHVVAPSLPGYGFSGPTTDRGWDVARIARAFAELMARLGYDRYVAQGGDWGAQITTRLGATDAAHCLAIHLNMPLARKPKEDVALDDADQAALAALMAFQRDEAAYSMEQSTKPQTLGVALNDSPTGLLAWIVEKFRTWTDCEGDVERSLTRDQMLDNVMLYWLTATAHSAGRIYYEATAGGSFSPRARIEVPVGVAAFPREIIRCPRSWAEARANVVHWTDMPRGGHFAAFEEPALLVADVRDFFRPLRVS